MVTVFEEEMEKLFRVEIILEQPLCVIHHEFSHLTWKIHAFAGRIAGTVPTEGHPYLAVPIQDVEDFPFPVPYQKVWQAMRMKGPWN